MASHRYWRIELFSNGGAPAFSMQEIELRSSIGGVDLTGSGTAIASSSEASYPASNAFDGTSAIWVQLGSSNSYAAWIGYDFGAGNECDINEVLLRGAPTSSTGDPLDFALAYSDDGTTYYVKHCWATTDNWSADESRVFNASNAYPANLGAVRRYWRVIFHSSGSAYSSCAELELRESSGGADETGSGSASAFYSESGSSPANAFDDNAATIWGSYNKPNTLHGPRWIQYDFGVGVQKGIVELSWKARSDGYANENPCAIIVLASDDASTWHLAWADLNTSRWTEWAVSETRTFTTNAEPISPTWPSAIVATYTSDEALAPALISAYYEQVFGITSSPLTIEFSLLSGSLPPGLALESLESNQLRIYGTPTTSGKYDFYIRAENAADPNGYEDKAFSITVPGASGGGTPTGICVVY